MKISQLAISLIVLLAGGALTFFSAKQQKAMTIVTYTHGGGSQVAAADATGLRKLNSELDATAAKVAGERATAVNATESARVEMRDQKDKCALAEEALKAKEAEKASLEADLAKQKEEGSTTSWVETSKTEAKGHTELTDIVDMCSDETPDYDGAVTKIGEVVKAQAEEAEALQKKLTKEGDALTAAEAELKKQQAELARLNEINDRFFREYNKNGQEFAVQAVDASWKYLTFVVGAESGLIKGETLLVKRGDTVITPLTITSIADGQVVAEFDVTKLPAGLRPAVGDRVFRLKPLGN